MERGRRSLGSTGPLPDQSLSVVESPLSSQWSQFCPLQVVQSQPLRVFPFHDAAAAMSCRGRPIHSPLLLCSRHSVRPCSRFPELGSLCLALEAACISRRAKSSWTLARLLTSILEGLVHFVLTVSLPNITQIHATLCDCSASISACFGLVSQSRVLTAFLFKKNPTCATPRIDRNAGRNNMACVNIANGQTATAAASDVSCPSPILVLRDATTTTTTTTTTTGTGRGRETLERRGQRSRAPLSSKRCVCTFKQ